VSARYRTVHFAADRHPGAYDRRMWSVDRLHPSERGHRVVAHAYAVMLRERGFPVAQLPGLEPDGPCPTRRAQAWWLATEGTLWVAHRATDLVPDLSRLAAVDWWYRVRGLAAELDERVEYDVAAALAALGPQTPPTGPLAAPSARSSP